MFDGPLPVAATFSKDPKMFAKGFLPNALSHGRGAYAYSGYGCFLDWISALGANLLGYDHPKFQERVRRQLDNGIGFSLPHWLERQVAEKLVSLLGSRVPGWTPEGLGVRFGLSGTDATTMAIRLARTVTGKQRIMSSGYHGYSEPFVSMTAPAWGVTYPQFMEDVSFENIAALRILINRTAAGVIIEQPMQEPLPNYWQEVRQVCDETGAILIVDEVVTWPRWALGGASEYYGIKPDLICIGKAFGNGIPISAIVGRKEYFEWFSRSDPCFVSSTGFGNAVSLAAADAVLDIWNQESVDHLWRIGQTLMDGLREAGYTVIGHPPRMLIQFPSLSHKTYFTLGMRDRGILWNRPTLPNLAHTLADVKMTLKAAQEIHQEMQQVDVESLMSDKLPMVLFESR